MAKSKVEHARQWWRNRIIRTKILIGIFMGVFVYQAIYTTYQMQKVEQDILETYNEKALNLSVAIDCIVLKDGVLFFNLLDRIGRTEVVGIQIDDNHPSCVERESFLDRLKTSHFEAFQIEQNQGRNGSDRPDTTAASEGEEIEIIEAVEEVVVGEEAPIPIDLTFQSEGIEGRMEETRIVIDGVEQTQLLYTVPINGVEVTFDLTGLPQLKWERFIGLTLTAAGNLLVLFIIIWVMSGQIVEPLKKFTGFQRPAHKCIVNTEKHIRHGIVFRQNSLIERRSCIPTFDKTKGHIVFVLKFSYHLLAGTETVVGHQGNLIIRHDRCQMTCQKK